MADEDVAAIVIDINSNTVRAGWAGDTSPRVVLDKSRFAFNYPVERGTISNWEGVEALLNPVFYDELQAASEEHPLLITESSLNNEADREKLVTLLFEKFNSPAVYVSPRATLSLYAGGCTSGIVFNHEGDLNHAVPVHEGCILSDAITIGTESAPIHEIIYNSIIKCDAAIHEDLCDNVVLIDKSTLLPDIADQVQTEIAALAPSTTKGQITVTQESENAAWLGGSILASLATFQQMWISQQEYNKSGVPAIHRAA